MIPQEDGKGTSMIKKVLMCVLLAVVCQGGLGPADETCCPTRDLAMMPTPMPAGQEQDLTNLYEGAVLHPLIWDAIESMDASCPEISFYDLEAKAAADDRVVKIEAAVRKQKGLPPEKNPWKPAPPQNDMDYILRGTLSADRVTGKNLSGNLEGSFTFHLELVDHHHNNSVLKEAPVSWTGGIMDGLNRVEDMAGSFRPLPPLLKGYERIAEKAKVEMPEDEVQAGHTETITLSELFDKDGRQTQYWQRLLVHVEKGKILNAEQVVEDDGKTYYIFRAKQGTVDVRYQAPDECKNARETLTVYNCCEKKEPPAFLGLHPKKEIGKKEFDIVCDRWNVELTYTKKLDGKEDLGNGMSRMLGGSYSAKVKAVVEYVKSKGSDKIFESKSAELDLNDTFWQHIVTKSDDLTCEGRISWTGTNNGSVKVPVIMTIHTRAGQCGFGFGRWAGDPITYKMSANLWGDPRCGGAKAWQGESRVKDVLFSTSGAEPGHVPQPIPFSKGQKNVSGQDQWTTKLWLVDSWGNLKMPIEQFPLQWRGMVIILVRGWGPMAPQKIAADINLSWKATKLGQ
jgi:hypothetical protein